uniref:RING-type domain-containing protein n=3 Tax=Lygus hesperus TaxID=30085 RepID=A0A0A9Y8U8_LYGHE
MRLYIIRRLWVVSQLEQQGAMVQSLLQLCTSRVWIFNKQVGVVVYIYLFSSVILLLYKLFLFSPHPLLYYTLICNVLIFLLYMYISYLEVCRMIGAIEIHQDSTIYTATVTDEEIASCTHTSTWRDLNATPSTVHPLPFIASKCCTICFDRYTGEDLVRILPCRHVYHVICIDRWLRRKPLCPTCSLSIHLHIHRDSSLATTRLRTTEYSSLS